MTAVPPLPVGTGSLRADFESLFPQGIGLAWSSEPGNADLLTSEERAGLARAIPKRVNEFAAGRSCAREALQQLGIRGAVLTSRPDRRPSWPEATVGSITHTAGLCVAVAGRRERFAGLGVDAEGSGRVHAKLYPQVCTPEETDWLMQLSETERAVMATLIFSAKEAFYKAQYEITEEFLYFKDARLELLEFDGRSGRFAIHPRADIRLLASHPAPVYGRFLALDRWVVTGVALSA